MKAKVLRLLERNLKVLRSMVLLFFQCSIAGSYLCPRWLRLIIYKSFGNKIETTHINPKCFIAGTKLSVGKRSFISFHNFFDLTDKIVIGNDVHIAMRSTFITSTHRISTLDRRAGEGISSPIVIGDGCWIGGGVTILPGVTVGKGTIVAAGAVVVKDCEPNALYAGIPAKKIRDL